MPTPSANCRRRSGSFGPLVVAIASLGSLLPVAANEPDKLELAKLPPAAAGKVDYERDVRPIFARACTSCHGIQKQKGGLRLDRGTEALKGGNSGVAVKPGESAHSRLVHLVGGADPDLKMPPKGPPLSAAEIGKLRAWIDQGARFPENESVRPSSIALHPSERHWAFRPIPRLSPPPTAQTAWVRNGVDAFVLARLEAEKIEPAPEADRVTLLRRLSLDLLGLPPAPRDVAEFVNDTRPDAYERLVDRLLASPHYGERWGRHWLDAARYADSDGFEKDTGRPFAWRYRHWVIDALNRDLPFDRFAVEQLAGDLLPGATTEQKVATGFHRNTLTNKEGGVDPEQFRVEQVVDRVNTTARVFLGLTLGCAQCHDHKYDPFSQREYYQFLAFFNSDVEADVPAPVAGEHGPSPHEIAAYEKKLAELKAALAAYEKKQLPALQKKWEDGLTLAELRKLAPEVATVLLTDPTKRPAARQKELAAFFAPTDKKFTQLQRAVAAHGKSAPSAGFPGPQPTAPGRDDSTSPSPRAAGRGLWPRALQHATASADAVKRSRLRRVCAGAGQAGGRVAGDLGRPAHPERIPPLPGARTVGGGV